MATTSHPIFNKMPRKMESEDDSKEVTWALPCSIAIVVKKIEDYDMDKNNVTMKLTIVLRIKCSGLLTEDAAGQALKEHLYTGLKLRLNETEFSIHDDLNT